MGFGRWYNAQKAGMQIAVAGGVLVMVGGIAAGVFGILDAGLAKPGAQTSTPAPAPALTTPAVIVCGGVRCQFFAGGGGGARPSFSRVGPSATPLMLSPCAF